jgi:hypothetical protein
MNRGPYRQEYLARRNRVKRLKFFLVPVLALLFPFLMSKLIGHLRAIDTLTADSGYSKVLAGLPVKTAVHQAKSRENEVVVENAPMPEISPPGNPGKEKPKNHKKPLPVTSAVPIAAKTTSVPVYRDQRRYYFNVIRDGTNGADIIAIDGFSGEVRVLSNVKGKRSCRPFNAENRQAAYYRYYVQAFHKDGAVSGIVMDMYTGEVKSFENIREGFPIRLFGSNTQPGSLRFTAQGRFNSPDIDNYITDTITGEVRWVSRPMLPKSLKLFKKPVGSKGIRRYFSWVYYFHGQKYLHCLDSFTGAVDRMISSENEGQHRFYDSDSLYGDMRYSSLVLYRYVDVQIISMDQFTSDCRFMLSQAPDWPVNLFDTEAQAHPFGFRRYTVRFGTLRQGLKALAFDCFTSRFNITFFPYDHLTRSHRFFHDVQQKGVDRYQAWAFFNDDDTVDIFTIDTYTSQIHIRWGVSGETTGNVF